MGKIYKLKELLKESKIESLNPDPNKRIRVRLNVLGVEKRPVENEVKGATKQFVRKAGQFIYGKQNLHKGAFGIVPQELDGFETSSDIPSFDVNNEIVLTEYIYYFFKGGNRYLSLESMAKGVGSKRIQPKELLELEINVPPKDIQEKLIKKLQALEIDGDNVSTEITHQLDLIKNLRQAFLREAMQGLLVSNETSDNKTGADLLAEIQADISTSLNGRKKKKPLAPITNEEIPFAIPENWTWCRLGELAENIVYGTSVKTKDEGEIPVLRMGNITTDGKILFNNLKYTDSTIDDLPALYLKYKDLLFNRTNSFELVGKSAVFNLEEKYTCASYLIIVRFLNINFSDFICSYINSNLCRVSQLEPNIIQQNGQANFNGTKLGNIIIPLPPLEIQERIVAKLDELMRYCDALEEQVKQSQQTNELLLQQVLREALGA